MKKALLSVFIVLFASAAIGSYFVYDWYYFGPCGVDRVSGAIDEFKTALGKWEDAHSIASNAARITLAGPISSLQEIRNDTEVIEIPQCMFVTKSLVTNGMDNYIKGFTAFMGHEDDSTVANYFIAAEQQIKSASDEIERVMTCAPECK